jgi:NodT family efflux transporter outer membrane factor (OMF) lipoprotein
MKRFVTAAVAAKMSYVGLFQFRGTPLSSIRVAFVRLFDDWRQGSVVTNMLRSDVSSSNARAARFRTVVGSPKRAFDADHARRWLRARAAKRARATPRFAEAGLFKTARTTRAVGLPGAAGVLAALLSGCTMGPDYVRPSAIASTDSGAKDVREKDFKERKGWKPITPADLADRGAWWTIYREPELDRLVAQVEISNQTVAAAEANYRQASEIIREGQAGLFPTITGNYSVAGTHSAKGSSTVIGSSSSGSTVSGSSSSSSLFSNLSSTSTPTFNWNYTAALNATWAVDVWGRIRRTVEADAASAQVSAADLANAKLLAQAQLVTAYFNLRAADELEGVIQDTLKEFRRTRDILKNQYTVGISTRADYITAENQVLSTEAQAIGVGVARAQYEHAIAVLTGRPPYELSIPRRRWAAQTPPRFPVTVPSRLLERRPDIAAAERQLQQLNALVGVAVANFYPNISLTGALTFIGPQPWPVIAANEAWSLIGGATQTMFDGGLLDAQLQAAKAGYEQGVANYRQTVLTAFQQVEDQLAAIRILAQEAEKYREAVKEAREAVGFYLNQYRVGTVAFTAVSTAQATLLSNEESALTARQNLFVASVSLIQALGGGWDAASLPALDDLSAIKAPPLPVPISALPATVTSTSPEPR